MITAIINALNPWKKWRIAEKELMEYREKLNKLSTFSKMDEFKDTPGIANAEYLFNYNENNIKNDSNTKDSGAIPDFIRLKNRQISDIKNTLWSILFFGVINIVLLYIIPVLGIIVLITNLIHAAPIFKQLYEQHKKVNGFKDKMNEHLNEGIKQVMGLTIDMTLPEDADKAKQANNTISLYSRKEINKFIGEAKNIKEINENICAKPYYTSSKEIEHEVDLQKIKRINLDIINEAEFNIINNAVNEAIGCKDNIDSYAHIINKISVFIDKIEKHPVFIKGLKSINKTSFEGIRFGDKKEMIFSSSDINSLDSFLPMDEIKYEVGVGCGPKP